MDFDEPEDWESLVKKHKSETGGYLKRYKAHRADTPCSHIARYLLEEFALGGLSANQVQQLAMITKLDGIEHTSIDKFASLGTHGKYTQHIHRDLLNYTTSYLPFVQLEANCVNIPLKIHKGEKTGTHLLPHYYLPPHKLISCMYSTVREAFQDKMLGKDNAMNEFWVRGSS